MLNRLLILLIGIAFVGCMEEPIPNKVNLSLIKEGFLFPYIIKVYKFESDEIDDSDILEEQISCSGNKKQLVWTKVSQLESKFKIHLLKEMNYFSEDSETFKELIYLNDELKSSDYIFFTGCYGLPKNLKGEPIPFYNYMYFLDTENRKFYSFEWVR